MHSDSTLNGHAEPEGQVTASSAPKDPPRFLYLVRHGQSSFNVEGRLPGQLPGILLTEMGQRQAYQAAVALSGIPLSAVVSSPLERAVETAWAIAKGTGLTVTLEPRLKDTDVGEWAGRKIAELDRDDPRWRAFVRDPTAPPAGIEGWDSVRDRSVAATETLLRDGATGRHIVVVAHADVVKLILGHYLRMHAESIRLIHIGNATISALEFRADEAWPRALAVNWAPLPDWLGPRVTRRGSEAEPHAMQPSLFASEAPKDGQPSLFTKDSTHG